MDFLAKKLKAKTRALDEELKSRELKFDDLEFDESDSGILGQGAFGIVRRATFLGEVSLVDLSAEPMTRLQHHYRLTLILVTRQAVAVKQVKSGASSFKSKSIFAAAFSRIDDATIDAFLAEIKIMTPLRHPNVIFFHGGIWTQGADRVCLVLEFAGRGSLDEWIGKDEVAWSLRDKKASTAAHGKSIAIDTARGLAYLHARDPPLVHRDVKPGNVMLVASFAAKVWDLGESKANLKKSDKGLATIVGSPMYIAPEIARAERYAEPADVFSFALVLLELVSGVSTEDRFKQMDIERKGISLYHQAGKRADLAFAEQGGTRGAALRLVELCWDDAPSKRPTMSDIVITLASLESEKYKAEVARTMASYTALPLFQKKTN